jgi:multicomponent Na+:H+ antiporter subunit F
MSVEALQRVEIVFILPLLIFCYFLAFIRLIRGPSLPDRVVALDLMSMLTIGIAAMYAITRDRPVFLDVATVLALLSFVTTVAFARFMEERARQ